MTEVRSSGRRGGEATARHEQCGAYGFRLAGAAADSSWLGLADPGWPMLELTVGLRPARDANGRMGSEEHALVSFASAEARIELGASGSIVVTRAPLRADFQLARPADEHELLHPYLGGIAAVAGRWFGRDAIHAGAFVFGGGAWAFLGGRTAGKSTLLAWLALQSFPIVGDDVLVLDDGQALPAPRFVDLRADAAAELGVGEELGQVGARERWRLRLPAVASAVPLRGWIQLGWADAVTLEPVPASRRLLELAPQLSVGAPPPEPASLIELAGLPMLAFRRPRDWRSAAAAGARLLDALDGLGR